MDTSDVATQSRGSWSFVWRQRAAVYTGVICTLSFTSLGKNDPWHVNVRPRNDGVTEKEREGRGERERERGGKGCTQWKEDIALCLARKRCLCETVSTPSYDVSGSFWLASFDNSIALLHLEHRHASPSFSLFFSYQATRARLPSN